MADEIVRAITADGYVKAMAITGKDMVERARKIHTLLPIATAALGRALMACSMMGAVMKEDEASVTLQIKGGGPLGTILAVADNAGNVRGYLQDGSVTLPEKALGKLDVGTAVGKNGTLTVIKDLKLKEPYVGSVELVSGEIAEDIAAYYAVSEQTPTACALGVLVDTDQSVAAAGGYFIQLLPGAPDDVIDRVEAGVAKMNSISHAVGDGLDAEGILKAVLFDFDLDILKHENVEYRCYCSRERVTRALISMGREELSELVMEQEQAQLTCQFCDRVYNFTKEELQEILKEM